MLSEKIWINGKYLDKSEGIINISTSALHYGTSIFEGIICIMTKYRGAIFRLEDHVERLFESAAALDFKITYSKQELTDAIVNLVKINNYKSCYIRPIIFKNTDYLSLESKKVELNVVVLCKKFNVKLYQLQMRKKIKVIISTKARNVWFNSLAQTKISGKYLNSAIAKIEARRNGFDDAILLNEKGLISEATSSNLFLVKDGIIKTPSCTNSLRGITRASLMEIGKNLGYTIIEQNIEIDGLYSADEVFLSNTARGVISISHVNSKRIAEVVRKSISIILCNKYIDIISGKDSEYQKWLTYI